MSRATPSNPPSYPSASSEPVSPRRIGKRPFPKERPLLHLGLFLATLVTVFFAALPSNPTGVPVSEGAMGAFVFVCAIMAVLLAHELGHYLAGRRHGIEMTLPYFIPAPFGFGTMGAVIRMKQIRHRRELLDVGVAGPLAGMVIAAPLAVAGIALSHLAPLPRGPSLILGNNLLFGAITYWFHGSIPAGQDIYLHPVALAAWFGFLVTSLNLMPASQLDGGHITKALFGRAHLPLSRAVFLMLAVWGALGDAILLNPRLAVTGVLYVAGAMAVLTVDRLRPKARKMLIVLFVLHLALSIYLEVESVSLPWMIWSVLLYVFRLEHPPIADPETPLSAARTALGWLSILVFILTFTPMPITMVQP